MNRTERDSLRWWKKKSKFLEREEKIAAHKYLEKKRKSLGKISNCVCVGIVLGENMKKKITQMTIFTCDKMKTGKVEMFNNVFYKFSVAETSKLDVKITRTII